MALVIKDRVKETSTTTGTGSFTLAGAATGFQSFASALADGDTTHYAIEDGTDWETGLGTWTESGAVLARTTVYESSNSGSLVNWGAGTKDVFITLPASRASTIAVYPTINDLPLSGNVQAGDQAFVSATNVLYLYNGSGWYSIAIVNQTPTVSGNSATYELATDGTATTVTMTGTDPEGFPLTWSATESGDTGIATTTNVNNVFTITPVTSGSGGTMSVTFSASDGVNTGTASSTFTLVFLSPLWADVTLSIGTSSTNGLSNETFIDRSSDAQTVTATNDPAQTAFHPYLDYWSTFIATEAGALCFQDSQLVVGTSDFTAEGWFWVDSSTTAVGTSNALFDTSKSTSYGYDATTHSSHFGCWMLSDYTIRFYSAGTFQGVTTNALNPNQWNHVALVRSSGTLTVYINGTSGFSQSNSTNYNLDGLAFGVAPRWTTTYAAGPMYMGEFRLQVGTAQYTINFTPPTDPLSSTADTKFLKVNKNNHQAIINGSTADPVHTTDASVSAYNRYGQSLEYDVGENKGSVYLATGDEVVIAHDSAISAGTGDFCLQFWMYASSGDNSGYKGLVAKYSGGAGGIWFQPNNGVLVVGFSTSILGTGTKNVMDNGWHHIAWTRSGSANKVFVDGEQELSFTASDDLNNTVDMLIGDIGTLSRNFQGYVADLKYDVGNATYTSAFTPPTAPVGNTNANLYLPMDNAGAFDRAGNATLLVPAEASGGAPLTDTSIKKFADSSMNFGATSDDKLWQVNGVPPLGSGPFTIEGWIYPTNVTGTWQSVITRDYGGTGGFRLYKTASAAGFTWYRSSTSTLTTDASTTPLVNNTWHHFAVCRDASDDLRIFIDGVQSGSTVANDYDYLAADPDNPLNIGSGGLGDSSADPFSGNLENIQVFVGVAKYTSNFTAPTTEQGINNQAES